MPRSIKSANPFYVLLVLAGVLFVVTAMAYGVMALTESRLETSAALAEARTHPLLAWMSRYGDAALMSELALLALFTFGAIGTDEFWQRRANRSKKTSASRSLAGGRE